MLILYYRLANNIGKIEPLLNTSYVEGCCAEVEKHGEYPSDRYLLLLVRLQSIADTPTFVLPHADGDRWSKLGSEAVNVLLKSFQRDLEQFKDTLEPHLLQNSTHPPLPT